MDWREGGATGRRLRHTLCTLQYLLHLTERLRELLCLARTHNVSLGVNRAAAAVVHRGPCLPAHFTFAWAEGPSSFSNLVTESRACLGKSTVEGRALFLPNKKDIV